MVLTLGLSEIVQLYASSGPVLPLTPERGPAPGAWRLRWRLLPVSPGPNTQPTLLRATSYFYCHTYIFYMKSWYIGNIVCYTRVSPVLLNPQYLNNDVTFCLHRSQTCSSIYFWFYMAMKLSVVRLISSNDIILDLWVKVWAPLYKLKMTRGAVCRLIPKQAGR